MKLQQLELHGLKAFRYGDHTNLSVVYSHPIQVVMGTNGCGKSRYLSQLNPAPVSGKENYSPEGLRRMTLSHQGAMITLESDYSRKDSIHTFIVTNDKYDGVNLNESGNTNIQRELVEKSLGLNKERTQLLYADISITSMSAGPRADLLSKLTPTDQRFIVEHEKRLWKSIRSLKSELAYLTGRESELLSRMLDDTEREHLAKRKATIESQIIEFISDRGGLNAQIGALSDRINDIPYEGNPDTLTVELEQHKEVLAGIPEIDVDGMVLQERGNTLSNQAVGIEKQLVTLYEQIRELECAIERSNQGHSEEKALRLQALQNMVKDLGPTTTEPLSSRDVQGLESILKDIEDVTIVLRGLNTPLISRSNYRNLDLLQQQELGELSRTENALTDLNDKLRTIEEEAASAAVVPTVSPCAKSACPLYTWASRNHDTYTSRRTETQAKIDELTKRVQSLRKRTGDRQEQLDELSLPMKGLDKLERLGETAPALTRLFNRDLITMLNNNPNRLLTQVEELITRTKNTWLFNDYTQEIDVIKAELVAASAVNDDFRKVLMNEFEQKEAIASDLKAQYNVLRAEAAQCWADSRTALHRSVTLINIEKVNKQIETARHRLSLDAERATLQLRYRGISDQLSAHTRELGNIDTTLNEQARIAAQYDGEIKRRKEDVETAIAEQTLIAEACKLIPENETKRWLKEIIDRVNVYISKVWIHPMTILFDVNEPLTYLFKKQVKDSIAKDISLSSKGEKKMIDLAFNLALRERLGMTDYPIFLDEMGEGFDSAHLNRMVDLFGMIMEDQLASQVVLVNHQSTVISGLVGVQTFVVDDSNVIVPQTFNENITIQ